VDRKHGPWGVIFLVSGLGAMIAVPMALGTAAALPFAVVSCLVAVFAGYRIWRASHPAASAWREVSRRALAAITFGVSLVAVLFAVTFPQIVLVIVGAWAVLIIGLFALLALSELRRNRMSSKGQPPSPTDPP
jgi:hypothetical protein